MPNVMERNSKIIRKITGLLSLSSNNPNEEEAQSAFLKAQQLMLKHDVSLSEVDADTTSKREVKEGQVTIHKKLYWWERHLAGVMSENFRVKNFLNWKKEPGSNHRKNAVCFMGYEEDVLLAKEMYLLAYEAITTLSKQFIEHYYTENLTRRNKRFTTSLKDTYMRGFIYGLEEKFDEQVAEMRREENALMVLVPAEVEEKYHERITNSSRPYSIPPIEEIAAFEKGYKDGHKIDYTKKTIDG